MKRYSHEDNAAFWCVLSLIGWAILFATVCQWIPKG